jgi:hypothetical protein
MTLLVFRLVLCIVGARFGKRKSGRLSSHTLGYPMNEQQPNSVVKMLQMPNNDKRKKHEQRPHHHRQVPAPARKIQTFEKKKQKKKNMSISLLPCSKQGQTTTRTRSRTNGIELFRLGTNVTQIKSPFVFLPHWST